MLCFWKSFSLNNDDPRSFEEIVEVPQVVIEERVVHVPGAGGGYEWCKGVRKCSVWSGSPDFQCLQLLAISTQWTFPCLEQRVGNPQVVNLTFYSGCDDCCICFFPKSLAVSFAQEGNKFRKG